MLFTAPPPPDLSAKLVICNFEADTHLCYGHRNTSSLNCAPAKQGNYYDTPIPESLVNTPGPSGTATPAGYRTPGASSIQPLILTEGAYPDIGTIHSWRGSFILVITCGSQLLDNVFMSGVNLSLPAVQAEFDIASGDLQWLISAYTLTFGGFLLFSGVLADRYGRRQIFSAGMIWLSIWTVACGFGQSFIQIAIFRALQGIGAAMTVPSSIGIISSYFVASERTKALSMFAASGAVGFCSGLIFGGFVTESLGWRYVFRIAVVVTGPLGILGWILLPKDRIEGNARPKLDFLGAGLSTAGLILLSFVLSSGGVYGWNKAFIIALLIVSVAMLAVFTYVEKKVDNPIMPLSLWKIKNFAALWIAGFVIYGGYQTVIYYTVLISQDVLHLSAGATAIRFLPMGAAGFAFSLGMGPMVQRYDPRWLLLTGLGISAVAPLPSSLMPEDDQSFWKYVLPTTLLVVIGVTICYVCIINILLGSVPVNVKSLCGGLVNTAFQIGSGVILALTSAIISTHLPASEQAFMTDAAELTPSLNDVRTRAANHEISTFGATILIADLLGRIREHLHLESPEDAPHDLNGGSFWRRHTELDNDISSLFLSLPTHLKLPAGIRNPDAIFVNMNIHSLAISLHRIAISTAEEHALGAALVLRSRQRCRLAAEEIVDILRAISHLDFSKVNPFTSFSLYLAATTFLQSAKDGEALEQSLANVHFIRSAMQTLKCIHPITGSFLLQLELDIELSRLTHDEPSATTFEHMTGHVVTADAAEEPPAKTTMAEELDRYDVLPISLYGIVPSQKQRARLAQSMPDEAVLPEGIDTVSYGVPAQAVNGQTFQLDTRSTLGLDAGGLAVADYGYIVQDPDCNLEDDAAMMQTGVQGLDWSLGPWGFEDLPPLD
ncbi:hypothetical protein MBLNU459_g3197t2 [Dothideomycetes sp. NU459]